MAAGLGFKTFTTGEVLTAADTNGYLMQGILVFATEAARNSAITSPQEGQFAFTKDTNSTWYYDGAAWVASGASGDVTGVTAGTGITVADPTGPVPTVTNAMATAITTAGDLIKGTGSGTFNRLGIGSTGQVLTVASGAPSWATPASMTLINSGGTTLTGSLVTISSIPATYKDLKIEVKNYRPATSNEFLRMRVNLDTTADVYGGRTLGLSDTNELWASYGYTSWDISVAMTSTTDNQGYFVVYLNDYANSTTFKLAQNSSIANATTNPTTAYCSNSQNLFYKPTTAINSVSFLTSSGNMTSGTAYVYGVI